VTKKNSIKKRFDLKRNFAKCHWEWQNINCQNGLNSICQNRKLQAWNSKIKKDQWCGVPYKENKTNWTSSNDFFDFRLHLVVTWEENTADVGQEGSMGGTWALGGAVVWVYSHMKWPGWCTPMSLKHFRALATSAQHVLYIPQYYFRSTHAPKCNEAWNCNLFDESCFILFCLDEVLHC